MLKTRIILLVVSVALIAALFLLPKVVVENDGSIAEMPTDSSATANMEVHARTPAGVSASIKNLRAKFASGSKNEKNAIFADSLADLYATAGKFDSAAWFAEEAAKFFNTQESWIEAGDQYYQAYSFAVDRTRQAQFASHSCKQYQIAVSDCQIESAKFINFQMI